MQFLTILLTFLTVQNALAFETLTCNVIVVAEDEYIEKELKVMKVTKGHGAPELSVEGKTNQVTAMADGKWLGLKWLKNGKLVAESVNLIRNESDQPRVLIMYNPNNTDEQVSIGCH